jgi:Mg2+/Co2+ transporter CorB
LILELLLEQPERLLITVMVVTNLMNIFAITLTAHELIAHFGSRGYWIHPDRVSAGLPPGR